MIKLQRPEFSAERLSGRILEAARSGNAESKNGDTPHNSCRTPFFNLSFSHLDRIACRLSAVISRRSFADRLMGHIRRKQHKINALFVEYVTDLLKKQRTMYDLVVAVYQQFKSMHGQLGSMSARVDEIQSRLARVEAGEQQTAPALKALNDRITRLEQENEEYLATIKVQIGHNKEILSRISYNSTQTPAAPDEDTKADRDALYMAFEDKFRGLREVIKERLRFYLPYVEKTAASEKDFPVLDIGCGRGEWLELLKEAGYTAMGIDTNRRMIAECTKLGLNAIEANILDWLAIRDPGSLGAVTAFHVIEHLPFESVINLLDASLRVLKPGGLLIFETPNPENLTVGSNTFYLDPTHRKPLPPAMMKFMAEARGFERVETIGLHSTGETHVLQPGSSVDIQRFHAYFNGPMDYGLIAWKKE